MDGEAATAASFGFGLEARGTGGGRDWIGMDGGSLEGSDVGPGVGEGFLVTLGGRVRRGSPGAGLAVTICDEVDAA